MASSSEPRWTSVAKILTGRSPSFCIASWIRIAIEYTSSPVAQPAIQTRNGSLGALLQELGKDLAFEHLNASSLRKKRVTPIKRSR